MSTEHSIAELIEESRTLERKGEYALALKRARLALDLAKVGGDNDDIAAALVVAAHVRFRLGQYDTARKLANQALSLTESSTDAAGSIRADALIALGACAAETNSLTEADDYYHRAADLARETGHPFLRIRALHALSASIYMPRGQFELALAADQEAYHIAIERGYREWLFFPLITMAWVYQITGQRLRAHATLNELKQKSPPGSHGETYFDYLSACLAQDEGDIEPVGGWLARARSVAEATGDPGLNVEVRVELSRYCRTVGDAPNARAWADDALTFARRVGYRHKQGQALIERGRAAWEGHDLNNAESDFQAALGVMAPLKLDFDLARAALLLAALLHQQKRPEAPAAWREAVGRIVSGGFVFLAVQERHLVFPLLAVYLNSPEATLVEASNTLLSALQRVPPDPLKINTLGLYEIWVGVKPVEKRALHQRKAGELFALLLLAPEHCLSFDQVMEALWPEREPGAALPLFHQATSALRRALEPDLPEKFPSRYLSAREGEISLRLPPGSQIDTEDFEAHFRRGEWEAALGLYRGDFLPNYLYANWAVACRQRLSYLCQQTLLAWSEQQLEQARAPQALEACRRVLASDAWQEQAVLLGMRACLAMGDRTGARRLYRNLEKILREELNAEPQAELQALYHSLIKPKK